MQAPRGGSAGHGIVDLTHDLFNRMASAEIPLKNFCKEEGFYYFGILTLEEHLRLHEALADGTLTRARIMALFRASLSEGHALGLIEKSAHDSPHFAKRKTIIDDAIAAHFAGKYTLSIPTLFPQIEGLMRDIGGLDPSAKFRPTIPGDIWNSRWMFGESDNAEYFNAFIGRLFEGQQRPDALGRNPVLLGINPDYSVHDLSMVLILSIIEIGKFLWFRDNTHPLVNHAVR